MSKCSDARSTTPRARRSTRARACSACRIPAARRSTAAATGDRRHSRSPSRACRPRLLVQAWAILYAVRDLSPGELAEEADLAASYQRAIVRALVADRSGGRRPDRDRRRRVRELELRRIPYRRSAARLVPTAMIASAARYTAPLPTPRPCPGRIRLAPRRLSSARRPREAQHGDLRQTATCGNRSARAPTRVWWPTRSGSTTAWSASSAVQKSVGSRSRRRWTTAPSTSSTATGPHNVARRRRRASATMTSLDEIKALAMAMTWKCA